MKDTWLKKPVLLARVGADVSLDLAVTLTDGEGMGLRASRPAVFSAYAVALDVFVASRRSLRQPTYSLAVPTWR